MNYSETPVFAPPEDFGSIERARFVIAAVPVEATVSYGSGASRGPAAILEASGQVELFDVEERNEPYRAGIATLEFPQTFSSAHDALAYAEKITAAILEMKKIPILLGGDHSFTSGALKAFAKKDISFSILHFDAHGDLRDTFHGDPLSHACALRRCLEISHVERLVQVGIRNVSNDPLDGSEFDFLCNNKEKIATWYAKDMREWDHTAILDTLGEYVYITFDVDALDPSIMPATGTPEPGGLDWQTTLAILKNICAHRTIIGLDVVELAPIHGFHAPNFLVAKLIYKILGFVARKEQFPI
ncbi:agmatinase [Candidatus Uhrbacteria bacterium]|nr:agmatinase [Candidatus Uhrbacteria bacterium]